MIKNLLELIPVPEDTSNSSQPTVIDLSLIDSGSLARMRMIQTQFETSGFGPDLEPTACAWREEERGMGKWIDTYS